MFVIAVVLAVTLVVMVGGFTFLWAKLVEKILSTVSDSVSSIIEQQGSTQISVLKGVLGLDNTSENPYSDYNAKVQAYPGEDEPPVEIPPWEIDGTADDLEADGWIRAQGQGPPS